MLRARGDSIRSHQRNLRGAAAGEQDLRPEGSRRRDSINLRTPPETALTDVFHFLLPLPSSLFNLYRSNIPPSHHRSLYPPTSATTPRKVRPFPRADATAASHPARDDALWKWKWERQQMDGRKNSAGRESVRRLWGDGRSPRGRKGERNPERSAASPSFCECRLDTGIELYVFSFFERQPDGRPTTDPPPRFALQIRPHETSDEFSPSDFPPPPPPLSAASPHRSSSTHQISLPSSSSTNPRPPPLLLRSSTAPESTHSHPSAFVIRDVCVIESEFVLF